MAARMRNGRSSSSSTPTWRPWKSVYPTEGGSDVYGGEMAFVRGDPPEMLKVVKQTKKPCWVYKLLACGRLAQRQDIVEDRFKYIFANIKSTDAVVVGMWDKHIGRVRHQQGVRDQVRRNLDQEHRNLDQRVGIGGGRRLGSHLPGRHLP